MNCEDCNNRGWVRSYSYDSVNHPDGYYVQHCGSCNRFKSDQEVRDWLNRSLLKVHNVDGTAMLIKKDGGTPEEWVDAYCDLLKAARHCNYLPCMDFASWVLGLSGNTLSDLEDAWEIALKKEKQDVN